MKRNFQSLDEKYPLVPLSRRLPVFLIEKAKIVRDANDIRVYQGTKSDAIEGITVPVASIGALILGNGVSITSEAARIAAARGCLLFVSGGQGSPIYLCSSQHRSPLNRIRQMRVTLDDSLRLRAAKILLERRRSFIDEHCPDHIARFPDCTSAPTIEKLLSLEANWAKRAYAKASKHYGIIWEGKKRANAKNNHPIVFLNHLCYSIADIAILHLGYDPNIGILHGRTKGGGLCYDIADVYKPLIALDSSFNAAKNGMELREIKSYFMRQICDYDIVYHMVKTLQMLFKEA